MANPVTSLVLLVALLSVVFGKLQMTLTMFTTNDMSCSGDKMIQLVAHVDVCLVIEKILEMMNFEAGNIDGVCDEFDDCDTIAGLLDNMASDEGVSEFGVEKCMEMTELIDFANTTLAEDGNRRLQSRLPSEAEQDGYVRKQIAAEVVRWLVRTQAAPTLFSTRRRRLSDGWGINGLMPSTDDISLDPTNLPFGDLMLECGDKTAGLSAAAGAGITVGILVAVALLLVTWFWWRTNNVATAEIRAENNEQEGQEGTGYENPGELGLDLPPPKSTVNWQAES